MAGLQRYSIKSQVYFIIKKKILEQKYDLGEAINITTLCKELSVSNTPIREALSQLEAEGLVTSSLNTKFKVVELTEKDLSELNHAVRILCSGGLDLCIFLNRQDKLIELLRKAIKNQKSALEKEDYFKFIQYAISFDEALIKATGNMTLLAIFNSLSSRLFLAVRYNHQSSANSRKKNILEHEQMLQNIELKNYENVKNLLTAHYDKHINADNEVRKKSF